MATARKVFISYSHEDNDFLKGLLTWFKPLEDEGLLNVWIDGCIKLGEKWDEEIDQALDSCDLAVVCLSANFIASDYVTRKELPKLIARGEAGRLRLLPVFVAPYDRQFKVCYRTEQGGEVKVLLSAYQDLRDGQRSWKEMTHEERERQLQKLNEAIRAYLQQSTPPPATAPRLAPVPEHDYRLGVTLRRQANNTLTREFLLPGGEPLPPTTIDWATIGPEAEEIATTLDKGDIAAIEYELANAHSGWGATLFRLLFGDEADWEPVMRGLFRRPPPHHRPAPTFAQPVRLLVHTDDERLRGLPWRLAAWNGDYLADRGWTIATGPDPDPERIVTLALPIDLLHLLADEAGEQHGKALDDTLRRLWGTDARHPRRTVVGSRAQLQQALRSDNPAILYLQGKVGLEAGRPTLWSGATPMYLSELAELLADAKRRPNVIYLDLHGDPSALARAPSLLQGAADLVLCRRLSTPPAGHALPLQWLQEWLGSGGDPLEHLRRQTAHTHSRDAERATLLAHGAYRDWTMRPADTTGRQRTVPPRVALDRLIAKSVMATHLRDLAAHSDYKAMAVVAYGDRGNYLDAVQDKLRHHLEDAVRDADINWYSIPFPEQRDDLVRGLEYRLREQFDVALTEPLDHLLQAIAPYQGAGKQPVVWLDWGLFGDGPGRQPKLGLEGLSAWLRFASEQLAPRCPHHLRVVSFATMELATAHHPRFAAALDEESAQPWCNTPDFLFVHLNPLGAVPKGELSRYIRNQQQSGCPPPIQNEMVDLLHQHTQGHFEQICALIEEAQRGSWYDLRATLRRGSTVAQTGDDDSPF